MFKFEWLLVFLALPLPFLVRQFLPKRESKPPSLKVPFFQDVSKQGFAINSPSKFFLTAAVIIWLTLILAAARPIWIEESVQVPITGRDLLIALDTSGSMQQEDFSASGQSRFSAVQQIGSEFVARRAGDRVGLVLFGTRPYLYAPLTFDVDTVVEFLKHSRVGFAGQQTAIGDTIGLAVKILRERDAENRILILLTDGDNSAGEIDPMVGMKLALEHGVRIFVIGIGIDHSIGSSKNELPEIAEETGGVYFHASNAKALQDIYAAIDEFEPVEADSDSRLFVTELYPWPLAIAMILAALVFTQHKFASFVGRFSRLGEGGADAI